MVHQRTNDSGTREAKDAEIAKLKSDLAQAKQQAVSLVKNPLKATIFLIDNAHCLRRESGP